MAYKVNEAMEARRRMELGARIKAAREAAGYSQAAFAEACGFGKAQSRISHYEDGRNEPSLGDILTMASVARVDPRSLTFGPTTGFSIDEERVALAYRRADARGRRYIQSVCDAGDAKIPKK